MTNLFITDIEEISKKYKKQLEDLRAKCLSDIENPLIAELMGNFYDMQEESWSRHVKQIKKVEKMEKEQKAMELIKNEVDKYSAKVGTYRNELEKIPNNHEGSEKVVKIEATIVNQYALSMQKIIEISNEGKLFENEASYEKHYAKFEEYLQEIKLIKDGAGLFCKYLISIEFQPGSKAELTQAQLYDEQLDREEKDYLDSLEGNGGGSYAQ